MIYCLGEVDEIITYADDTATISVEYSWLEAIMKMNSILEQMANCLKYKEITLNVDKSLWYVILELNVKS